MGLGSAIGKKRSATKRIEPVRPKLSTSPTSGVVLGKKVRVSSKPKPKTTVKSGRVISTPPALFLDKLDTIFDRGTFVWPSALRASSVAVYCPRAEAIERVYGEPDHAFGVSMGMTDSVTPISINLMNTFEIGSGVHQRLQDHTLGPSGYIFGGWVCVRCGALWGPVELHPHHTKNSPSDKGSDIPCPHKNIRFLEPFATDYDLCVSGHMDGFCKIGTETAGLEIKTISKGGFDALRKPLSQHLIQTGIYGHLFEVTKMVFLYVSKGWHPDDERVVKFGSGLMRGPFKEFVVDIEDSPIPKYLQDARKQIVAAVDLKLSGIEPTFPSMRKDCKTPDSSRCFGCPVADACWELNEHGK